MNYNHPLNATPFFTAFPLIARLMCKNTAKAVEEEDKGINQPLLSNRLVEHIASSEGGVLLQKRKKKKGIKVSGDEVKLDPYLTLGYGMIAYRNLQQIFIIFFLICSVLLIPVLHANSIGGGIEIPLGYAKYSLGNQGYSSAYCQSFPVQVGQIPITCAYGTLKVNKYGINLGIKESNCVSGADKTCENILRKDIDVGKCAGKSSCDLDIKQPFSVASGADFDKCTASSTFWVTFDCQMPAERMAAKKQDLLLAACIGTLICLLFSANIYYLRKYGKIQQIQWDC